MNKDGLKDNVLDIGVKLDASAAKIRYENDNFSIGMKSATVEAEASTMLGGGSFAASTGSVGSLVEVESSTKFEFFGREVEVSGEAGLVSFGSRKGLNFGDDGMSFHGEKGFGSFGLGGKVDIHK